MNYTKTRITENIYKKYIKNIVNMFFVFNINC